VDTMAGIYISLPFMVPDSNCTTGVFVARSAHTRAVLEALYTDPVRALCWCYTAEALG